MRKNPEYYEFYGELISNNIFMKRLVILLVVVNVGLAFLSYLGFTRPGETYVINDGYAYSTNSYGNLRSIHEVRQFAYEFAKSLLEFNRDNFNNRLEKALRMCSPELERVMFESIKGSEIPKIVQSTTGMIRFKLDELAIRKDDPYIARVAGKQVFPGQSPIPLTFTLQINVVDRSEVNPFGLRIINYTQDKS